MKRHFQCAEQQASPSNPTKYCACHAKWFSWLMSVTHDTSFTMRRATDLILRHHQVLRLPRKMTRIIYPRDIWNVIYNARSNMHHLPTSPNAAPATKNDAHHWLPWHMQRHLQCAEQQASPSNLTKYCACHAKLHSKIKEKFAENSWRVNSNAGTIRTWSEHDPTMNSSSRTRPFAEVTFHASETHFVLKITTFRAPVIYPNFTKYCACHEKWQSDITKYCACHEKWCASLIVVTYATSFTMRGATGITLQPHQMLRLPRKKRLVLGPRLIWNVIYNAQSNRSHPPTSRLPRKMTRIIYPRDIWNVIYNARRNMHHLHQMLPLPRKMMRIIDCRDICSVIYNARSNRHHPPTSPNTAPATQNYTPKSEKNSPKTADASIPMRGRSEHDPTMIRTWTRHLAPARSPRLLFTLRRRILYWKLQHFALRLSTQISPNTAPATKSDTPTSPNTAPATKSDTPTSPNAAPATKSDTPTSPNTAPAMKSDTVTWLDSYLLFDLNCVFTKLLLDWAVWAVTSLLLLAWAVTWLSSYFTAVTLLNCYFTELLLYWGVTFLSCYFTELLLYWAVTWLISYFTAVPWLSCYFTELLLYWTVTSLSCYFTELFLYWAVTLLGCYFTELLLDWTVTWLSCYFTELLLYWAVNLLSCYCTELLLYWAVTLLSCYLTELLLDWAVTLLNCYFTELLLYWAVTLLSWYFTELLLYWTVTAFLNLRNSEVSQLNFLWKGNLYVEMEPNTFCSIRIHFVVYEYSTFCNLGGIFWDTIQKLYFHGKNHWDYLQD